MRDKAAVVEAEIQRIRAEYQRRKQAIPPERDTPWHPGHLFVRLTRKRDAALLLYKAGVFPTPGTRCLEVGFGSMGWLGDLITWRVREVNLHGIELDPALVERVHAVLPQADLRAGDATALPWDTNSFDLVVASTVFTSILDPYVRTLLAAEITRVLAPGGALLWYDFAVNNPRNSHVRKVTRRELLRLFPRLRGRIQSVTLAPFLARLVAPRSWALASLLEAIPLLRTHLLAVLIKSA